MLVDLWGLRGTHFFFCKAVGLTLFVLYFAEPKKHLKDTRWHTWDVFSDFSSVAGRSVRKQRTLPSPNFIHELFLTHAPLTFGHSVANLLKVEKFACLSCIQKPLTRVSKQVPGVHGKKGLERGWQKRLAEGWRKLAKVWRRVGRFLAPSNIAISEAPV